MTVIREARGPEVEGLHARAVEQGGMAFADSLCDTVEDCGYWCRRAEDGRLPAINAKDQREETERIATAARKLRTAVKAMDEMSAALSDMSPDTRQSLFLGGKPLLVGLTDHLRELLPLTREHLRGLTANRGYHKQAAIAAIRAVFKEYGVPFVATANRSKRTGIMRQSLAVHAVTIATGCKVEAAKKAISRLGTKSRPKKQ